VYYSDKLEIPSVLWSVDTQNWRDTVSGYPFIEFPGNNNRSISFISSIPSDIDLNNPIKFYVHYTLANNQPANRAFVWQTDLRYTALGENFTHSPDQTILSTVNVSNLSASIRLSPIVFNLDPQLISNADIMTITMTRLTNNPSDNMNNSLRFHSSMLRYYRNPYKSQNTVII
jgi:hypothetical protein